MNQHYKKLGFKKQQKNKMLKVKVFANGIRVKELELKNLRYFFRWYGCFIQ